MDIINAYDHLVSVHDFIAADGHKERIQSHVMRHFAVQARKSREDDDSELKTVECDDCIFILCDVTSDTLSSILIHCHLLHRGDRLFRAHSDDSNADSLFATVVQTVGDVKDEERPSPSVDFDRSVLLWLPFGENPAFSSFRDEIVNNQASTISEMKFKRYHLLCSNKIKTRIVRSTKCSRSSCTRIQPNARPVCQGRFGRAPTVSSSADSISVQ